MTAPKINLTELLADREAGTPSGINATHGDGNLLPVSMRRRIARLPDLEAAYIEAVGLLREALEEDSGLWTSGRIMQFLGDLA